MLRHRSERLDKNVVGVVPDNDYSHFLPPIAVNAGGDQR
jgi:hypothetical protein